MDDGIKRLIDELLKDSGISGSDGSMPALLIELLLLNDMHTKTTNKKLIEKIEAVYMRVCDSLILDNLNSDG